IRTGLGQTGKYANGRRMYFGMSVSSGFSYNGHDWWRAGHVDRAIGEQFVKFVEISYKMWLVLIEFGVVGNENSGRASIHHRSFDCSVRFAASCDTQSRVNCTGAEYGDISSIHRYHSWRSGSGEPRLSRIPLPAGPLSPSGRSF